MTWKRVATARVLIPGGSLICYTDQSRLDRNTSILDAKLRYWWLLARPHDQLQRLPGKFVIAGHKPVLWYVKDHRRGPHHLSTASLPESGCRARAGKFCFDAIGSIPKS